MGLRTDLRGTAAGHRVAWTGLPRGSWAYALAAVVLALSLYLSAPIIGLMLSGRIDGIDWALFTTAGERITAGQNPYAFGTEDHNYKWSPLLAYGFAVIAPIGVWGWTALALGSLALLRDWRLIGLFLVSYPLWIDLYSGASFWFVPLVALLALHGSVGWSLAFVALTVLIPRPLMLPVVAYLLWQRPGLRAPAVILAAALIAGSFATGWGMEWIAQLTAIESGGGWSIDPPLWATVALLPVAGWLTWRGRLGLASLAVSPYVLPSYLLMLTLEARRR